jgi:hypothetical protein
MFAIYDKVCKREEIKSESLQTRKQETGRELEIYRQGLQQGWMHVNISLYKMWTELDILDFESIQSKLQQTLEFLAKDPSELNKWAEKFKEYLKEQGK